MAETIVSRWRFAKRVYSFVSVTWNLPVLAIKQRSQIELCGIYVEQLFYSDQQSSGRLCA